MSNIFESPCVWRKTAAARDDGQESINISLYVHTHIYSWNVYSLFYFLLCISIFCGGRERKRLSDKSPGRLPLLDMERENEKEKKRALTSKNGHSSMPIGWAGSVVCYPTVLYTAQHHTHRYIINARRNMSSFEFLDEYVHLFFVLLSCRHSFVLFFEHFQVHWSC